MELIRTTFVERHEEFLNRAQKSVGFETRVFLIMMPWTKQESQKTLSWHTIQQHGRGNVIATHTLFEIEFIRGAAFRGWTYGNIRPKIVSLCRIYFIGETTTRALHVKVLRHRWW